MNQISDILFEDEIFIIKDIQQQRAVFCNKTQREKIGGCEGLL